MSRMVEEGPVELTDPARVSVDLGGDERVSGRCRHRLGRRSTRTAAQGRAQGLRDPLAESVDLGIAGPPKAAGKEPGRASEAGTRARDGIAIQSPGDGGRRPRPARGCRVPPQAVDRRSREPKAQGYSGQRRRPAHAAQVFEIKPARPMRHVHRLLLVIVPCLVIATVAWRYRQKSPARDTRPSSKKAGLRASRRSRRGTSTRPSASRRRPGRPSMGWGGRSKALTESVKPPTRAAIFVNLIPQELGDLLDEAGRTDHDHLGLADSTASTKGGRSWSIRSSPPCRTGRILAIRAAAPDPASRRGHQPRRTARPLRRHRSDRLPAPRAGRRPLGDRVIFGATLASFKYDDSE